MTPDTQPAAQFLGFSNKPGMLDCEPVDNILLTGEAINFTLHGDAAPHGRFNHRAALKPGTIKP